MTSVEDFVRERLSMGARRRIAFVRLRARMATARWRALPSFLITGAQRAGTSSLYKYLGAHPRIIRSLRKETDYFSVLHSKGESWYRAHFPFTAIIAVTGSVTFEATPDYLLHPHAPSRASELLPEARIVVLLRDPVERAFSHHQHMTRLGFESLSFHDAVCAEPERTQDEVAGLAVDPNRPCRNFLRYSYLARGRYAEQLQRWVGEYSRDRIKVIFSDDLFRKPEQTFQDLLAFLNLDPWQPSEFRNYSRPAGTPAKEPFPEDLRKRLNDYYRPHNEQLAEFLGRDLPW